MPDVAITGVLAAARQLADESLSWGHVFSRHGSRENNYMQPAQHLARKMLWAHLCTGSQPAKWSPFLWLKRDF